jgi:hypothetical protein
VNRPNQGAAAFSALQVQPPNQTLHLTGAAILVSRGMKVM